MKRVVLMFVAVVLCSLSAWCQSKLINIGLEILDNNQSVTKIEEILTANSMDVTDTTFDEYVNCSFSVSAENSDNNVWFKYRNDCYRNIAVGMFVFLLNSDLFDELEGQLSEHSFSLVNDDGNELIYRNGNKIQCNIMFSDSGEVTLFVSKESNRIF